jgi:GAF domain-containing protein
VVQLPFVLWAALRFGPGAVSMALLSMTCLAAWSVVSGHGAAAPVDPERIILTIQLFLISAATTLLVVAVLIEERRLSMHAVSERLRFERLLFEFTRAFAQVPSDKMDAVSREWLARNRVIPQCGLRAIVPGAAERRHHRGVCEWRHPGFAVTPPIVFTRDFPWIVGEVISRRPVVLHRADALPPGADQDRASLRLHGYNALLVVPMLATERVVGALSLGTVTERAWSDEVVANLLIMCECWRMRWRAVRWTKP